MKSKRQNRSRERTFILRQPRGMPGQEVAALGEKEGLVFNASLVYQVRSRARAAQRERMNGHTNGATNGHAKPARGGRSPDIQAALDMLIEAIRADTTEQLRKRLSL